MSRYTSYNNLVPISKAVNAAILDNYGSLSDKELFTHWAARIVRKLFNEILPISPERILLTVNENTNTATLPCNLKSVNFVGVIVDGRKVPIPIDQRMTSDKAIKRIAPNVCPECNQDLEICKALNYEYDSEMIDINGTSYEQATTRKIYPDGGYFSIKSTPFWDEEDDKVVFKETSELITSFEMEKCGCIKQTEENEVKLKAYCPMAYSICCPDCSDAGGYGERFYYNVFDDIGLLQMSRDFNRKHVYVEYDADIPKYNGKIMMPSVAFETVVEWIKFKSVQGKMNVPLSTKEWQRRQYTTERNNMEIIISREGLSLDMIANILRGVPSLELVKIDRGSRNKCAENDKRDKGRDVGRYTSAPSPTSVEIQGDDTFIILND